MDSRGALQVKEKKARHRHEVRTLKYGAPPSEFLAAGFREREAQERRVVAALLRHFSMDDSLIARGRPMRASDGNWLHELLQRVLPAIPPPFRTVYCGGMAGKTR